MPTLKIHAFAKLNLYLEVLGRRMDGFHRLETIFQTIDLRDEITITQRAAAAGINLRCDTVDVPTDASNLVWRAAAAFIAGRENEAGRLELHLRKGIPHGAGLGGGSSDAAAVLRALAQIFPGWHDAAALHRLACELGSDVPFFLVGGTAHGVERGEVLTPLPDSAATNLTVIMPPEHLATPAVFAELTAEERGPREARGAEWWRAQLATTPLRDLLHNRLTAAAVRKCPTVGTLLSQLGAGGVPCLMSGSGAACFAFADRAIPTGMRGWQARFVSRAEALAPATSG